MKKVLIIILITVFTTISIRFIWLCEKIQDNHLTPWEIYPGDSSYIRIMRLTNASLLYKPPLKTIYPSETYLIETSIPMERIPFSYFECSISEEELDSLTDPIRKQMEGPTFKPEERFYFNKVRTESGIMLFAFFNNWDKNIEIRVAREGASFSIDFDKNHKRPLLTVSESYYREF